MKFEDRQEQQDLENHGRKLGFHFKSVRFMAYLWGEDGFNMF
jgi:hypothetical protein